MTDPLDTLRPEVREAINRTGMTVEMFDTLVTVNRDDYDIIRAELLRLAHDCKEHADWRQLNHQAYFDADQRAEKAEAELAALKARIAEAPIIHAEKTWRGTLFVNLSQHDVDLLDGKRVRLVVEE